MTKPHQTSREQVFIRRVLIVIALVAVALLLWNLRSLVLMLFGAVVVATVFRALADVIRDRLKLPDGLSVALSIVLIIGFLIRAARC